MKSSVSAAIVRWVLPTLCFLAAACQSVAPVFAGSDKPASPAAVSDLVAKAETAYRERQWQVAMDAFKGVVALQPRNAAAWFRIGNLHHRKKHWLAAAVAYRKAADHAGRLRDAADRPREPSDPDRGAADRPDAPDAWTTLRTKALLNLAAVNLEIAESALTEAVGADAGVVASAGAGAGSGSRAGDASAARQEAGTHVLAVDLSARAKQLGAALDARLQMPFAPLDTPPVPWAAPAQ